MKFIQKKHYTNLWMKFSISFINENCFPLASFYGAFAVIMFHC